MKRLILLCTLGILIALNVSAQEEETKERKKEKKEKSDEMQTLFGRVDSYGGYGAISLNYSQIDNADALLIGGKGAWVVGHNMAFGIGGYGFFTDYVYDTNLNLNTNYQGGYGGFYFEPIILPKFPAHITIPIFIGVGGIAYVSDINLDDNEWETAVEDNSAFVVVEPGVELEMNMFKYFRMAFGVYYRYTSDVNLQNIDPDILHGLSYGITLKLGKF